MRVFIGLGVQLALLVAIASLFVWVRRSREESHALRPSGRISLLSEAVGYIGAILVVAGGGVAIAQRWEEMSDPTRLTILATATVFFLGMGFVTSVSDEPAFRRLTGVLWLLGTGATAGTLGFFFTQMIDVSDETALFATFGSTTVVAALLYAMQQGVSQHLALYAGVLATTFSSLSRIDPDYPAWIGATVALAIGLGWMTLGWRRVVSPWWVAVPVGMVTALIAPAALQESSEAAMFSVGIAMAAGLMAFSVAARFTPGLLLAAIGLFGYVTGTVVRYLGDTLGVPAALTLTGVVILVVAAWTARLVRVTRTPPAEPEAPAEPLRKVS